MSGEKKLSVICHSVVAVVLAALLGAASVYDLQISKAIGDQNAFFGQFFAVYAEYPSYLLPCLCGVIIFYNYDIFARKYQRIIVMTVGLLFCYGGWLVFGLRSTKLTEIPHLTLFAVFSALIFGSLALAACKLIDRKILHKLFKFSVFAIVFTLVSLAVMQLFKNVWCRMRYRDMLKAGSFDGFSPWWLPMIGRDKTAGYDYTSFPSGHTSAIVHLYVCCVLCDIFPSKRFPELKYWIYGAVTAVCAAAAISRIVNCAHFLSDVVVGGALTYAIFWGLKKAFFGKGNYVGFKRIGYEENGV